MNVPKTIVAIPIFVVVSLIVFSAAAVKVTASQDEILKAKWEVTDIERIDNVVWVRVDDERTCTVLIKDEGLLRVKTIHATEELYRASEGMKERGKGAKVVIFPDVPEGEAMWVESYRHVTIPRIYGSSGEVHYTPWAIHVHSLDDVEG